MGMKELAEGVILQSIEDLWSKKLKSESIRFFNGGGFSIYAEIADMNLYDEVRLIDLVNRIIEVERRYDAARGDRCRNRTFTKCLV